MSTRFSQLAFIVDDVDGAAELAAQLPPHVFPIPVDHRFDGLAQIASTLRTCGGLDAIHLFCHVDEDELSLGTVRLAAGEVGRYVGDLSELARALGGRGHLLVYPGGAGEPGAGLLEALRRVLGPGVASVRANTQCGAQCSGWCLGRYVAELSAA